MNEWKDFKYLTFNIVEWHKKLYAKCSQIARRTERQKDRQTDRQQMDGQIKVIISTKRDNMAFIGI